MNLKSVGIDLAYDARRIATERSGFVSKLNSKDGYYDALRHIIGVRDGFVRKIENAQAHTPCGLYKGYVNEDVNPSTGYSERIYYAGNDYTRVVYDENNVPVGAYEFIVKYDRDDNTMHFDAYVLAPGEKGEIMWVKPDGSKNIFEAPGNFFEGFSKKWLRPIKD